MRIVIVGAGLSGLYLASRLSAFDDITEISIYEKARRIGGKIRSEQFDGNVLERGAWRISNDHKLVQSLITKDMKTFTYPIMKAQEETARSHCPDVSIFASRMLQLGITEAVKMDLLSGYVGSDVRPDDGSERHHGAYVGLVDGYETLAKNLYNKIIQCDNIKVYKRHVVRDVKQVGKQIMLTVIGKHSGDQMCDAIVFACSAHQAMQCCQGDTARSFRPLTASIQPLELCRIYGHVDHCTDHVDLDSPLYRSIAVKNRDWNILSYTSGKLAVAMRDVLVNDPHIGRGIKWTFWPNGTHMWRPAFNFDMARNAWNSVCVTTGVYIVGESLSDMQGWCEGAMRSVLLLLRQFNKSKTSSHEIKRLYETRHPRSKIVFYRGRPIDVSQWAERHPGGPDLIKNIDKYTRKENGKNTWDITETFDNAHLDDDACRQLFSLQVYS